MAEQWDFNMVAFENLALEDDYLGTWYTYLQGGYSELDEASQDEVKIFFA